MFWFFSLLYSDRLLITDYKYHTPSCIYMNRDLFSDSSEALHSTHSLQTAGIKPWIWPLPTIGEEGRQKSEIPMRTKTTVTMEGGRI